MKELKLETRVEVYAVGELSSYFCHICYTSSKIPINCDKKASHPSLFP